MEEKLVLKAKMTIEYDFQDHYAQGLIKTMRDGYKWKAVVWDLEQKFRADVKYADDGDKFSPGLKKAREYLSDLLEERDLNLYN